MFDLKELERAHEIVGQAVPPTPAHAWPLLSERLGASVVVKHENHTPIGAFKVRGGLVYFDRLKRERPHVRDCPIAEFIDIIYTVHAEALSFEGAASCLRRDNLVSVLYSEELNSTKSSVSLQRTDRHGILGQKSSDFQRFL